MLVPSPPTVYCARQRMLSRPPDPSVMVPAPDQLPARPANGPESARALGAALGEKTNTVQSSAQHFSAAGRSRCLIVPSPNCRATIPTLNEVEMLHGKVGITIYPYFHRGRGTFEA